MLDFTRKKARSWAALLMLAFILLPSGLMALPVAVEQVQDRLSLKHSAFFLVDAENSMSILEASSPLSQNLYSRLEDRIPVASTGALWLRFSLIKNNVALTSPGGQSPALLLDLGQEAAGARLYVAESVTTDGEIKEWREFLPTYDGKFELPEPELLPLTVYARLEGIPSLWFDPVLTRPEQQEGAFDWHTAMQIALGLVLAIVLIRGMTENEEWRFWAGAILACVMVTALFGHYGSETQNIYLKSMPRLLAPGLAVMLMPHLGRYMLNSRGNKALDYTLIALSIPGVITALAPLVPGLGWTARLLPLAPLLLLPLVILGLSGVKNGRSGALLYTLFNLLPFTGAALALFSLFNPSYSNLYSLGSNLTVLGYLAGGALVARARPSRPVENGDFFPPSTFLGDTIFIDPVKHSSVKLLTRAEPDEEVILLTTDSPQEPAAAGMLFTDELQDGPPISLHTPELPHKEEPGEAAQADIAPLPDLAAEVSSASDTAPEPEIIDLGLDLEIFSEVEELQKELDPLDWDESTQEDVEEYEDLVISPEPESAVAAEAKMKKEENVIYIKDEEEPGLVLLKPATGSAPIQGLATPGQQPAHNWEYTAINRLENALREPYEQLVSQLDELKARQDVAAEYAEGLGRSLQGLGLMLDNLERLARGEPFSGEESQSIFNLSQLIRHIHDDLLPLAEQRNLTLSWFVAPGLPAYFKGTERELTQAVKFLMQGTIEGAATGAVQLTVRPGTGPYSGQIQFSLLESGLQPSHLKRPSGWLNKAWELAAASGGSFNIDFIPGKGMSITLALPLTPVLEPQEKEEAAEDPLELPGSAALAEFAPGPEPAGAEDPLPDFPPIEEEAEDDVILLTDAIVPVQRQDESAEEAAPENEEEAPEDPEAESSSADSLSIEELAESALDLPSEDSNENSTHASAPNDSSAQEYFPGKYAAEEFLAEEFSQDGYSPDKYSQDEADEAIRALDRLLEQEPGLAAQEAPQASVNGSLEESAPVADSAGNSTSESESATVISADAAGYSEPPVAKDVLKFSGEAWQSAPETPAAAEEPPLLIFKDDGPDGLEFAEAPLSSDVSAPRPLSQKQPELEQEQPVSPSRLREYIIIADMAASGRRLIARRLDGLPHKLIEARNAQEIVRSISRHPVGLLIIDADMPEADVKQALKKVADYNLSRDLPPTPSLCLLSHESQAERMARLGCSESQIKSSSRTQFRQAVLRLCPHPDTAPSELLPESPLLRQNPAATAESAPTAVEPQLERANGGADASIPQRFEPSGHSDQALEPSGHSGQALEPSGQPDETHEPTDQPYEVVERSGQPNKTVVMLKHADIPEKDEARAAQPSPEPLPDPVVIKQNKKGERVPMLDLIVASLDQGKEDENNPADQPEGQTSEDSFLGLFEQAPAENPVEDAPVARKIKEPYPISGMNESMEQEMVPLIPGLLVVLEDSLNDLAEARLGPDAGFVKDVSKRMAGQGSTFGLNTLERMARCVERAAEAGDVEAIRDFSDELLSLGRRYLVSLKETHAEYANNE